MGEAEADGGDRARWGRQRPTGADRLESDLSRSVNNLFEEAKEQIFEIKPALVFADLFLTNLPQETEPSHRSRTLKFVQLDSDPE